jgi:hypothetical protein
MPGGWTNTSGLELLFKKMMEDFDNISRDDAVYRRDIEELGTFRIQWNVCDLTGWQILELDNYRYRFGI